MTEAQPNHGARPRLRRGWTRLRWPALALAALLLFNLAFTPAFFTLRFQDGHLYGSLIDILNRAAPVMLLALGMTVVIATAGVDLSVGAVMAIAGSVAAALLTQGHFNLITVLVLALVLALLAGVWNGLLVALFDVQPIVATLVLMVAGRGIAQLITGGQIITFERRGFAYLGSGHFLALPVPVVIVAAAVLLLGLTVRRTALGLFIEATGDNPAASRLAGVPVPLVKIFAYALAGLCAGVAGLIVTADIKAADANNAGLYLELDAILAVVLGGTALTGGRFTFAGSLLGALFIQTLTTTILSRNVPVEWTLVVKAVVVLAVCLLQSETLRGRFLPPRIAT